MKRPHIKEINGAKVLMVEGKPFIMLAGEVRKKVRRSYIVENAIICL